jgi:hypothetical protein
MGKSSGKLLLLIVFILILVSLANAQESDTSKFSQAIEDNSYFIEEAYNQEERVVQHISNGYYTSGPTKDFTYSFTQEWPFLGQKHQLSYTIGYSWLNSNAVNGFTDILINYRYQLTSHDAVITLAPRISLILPTGNKDKGLGNGVVGLQFSLPASKRVSQAFACHANLGFTCLPGVKTMGLEGQTYKNTQWNIFMGGSVIWLTAANFNLMLEGLHIIARSATIDNQMKTQHQTIISPGFRYAINIKKLQIVPGLAIPFSFQDGNSHAGAYIYLSFEHPY